MPETDDAARAALAKGKGKNSSLPARAYLEEYKWRWDPKKNQWFYRGGSAGDTDGGSDTVPGNRTARNQRRKILLQERQERHEREDREDPDGADARALARAEQRYENQLRGELRRLRVDKLCETLGAQDENSKDDAA